MRHPWAFSLRNSMYLGGAFSGPCEVFQDNRLDYSTSSHRCRFDWPCAGIGHRRFCRCTSDPFVSAFGRGLFPVSEHAPSRLQLGRACVNYTRWGRRDSRCGLDLSSAFFSASQSGHTHRPAGGVSQTKFFVTPCFLHSGDPRFIGYAQGEQRDPSGRTHSAVA